MQGLVENRITEREQMVKNAVVIDESELSAENAPLAPMSPSRWPVRTRKRNMTFTRPTEHSTGGNNGRAKEKPQLRACPRASRCRCAVRSWPTCRLRATTPSP